MDYTNYYDIRNSLKCQSHHLLFKLWEGRKYDRGSIKHDGHKGWYESYELAGVRTGFRAMARLFEFERDRFLPISKIHIKADGKWKYFYSLNCDPENIDWKEVLTNWKKWKYKTKMGLK